MSDALFKVPIVDVSEDGDPYEELQIFRKGEEVLAECDGDEPEDNYHSKDWAWRRCLQMGCRRWKGAE